MRAREREGERRGHGMESIAHFAWPSYCTVHRASPPERDPPRVFPDGHGDVRAHTSGMGSGCDENLGKWFGQQLVSEDSSFSSVSRRKSSGGDGGV